MRNVAEDATIQFSVDASKDFNLITISATDFNITGFTSIQAGTVDADFDAITATSYGGVVEANLLDKTAAETISGIYRHSAELRVENEIALRGLNLAGSSFRELIKINASDKVTIGNTTDDSQIFSANAPVWFDGATSRSWLGANVAETITGQWSFTNRIDIDDAVLRMDSRGSGTSFVFDQRIDNSSASRPYWNLFDNANVKQWDCLMTTGGSLQWRHIPSPTEIFLSFVVGEGVRIRDGLELRIFDLTDTDFISLSHDGTDGIINLTNATNLNITGANVNVDGNFLIEGYSTGKSVIRSTRFNIKPGATPGTDLDVTTNDAGGRSYNSPSITNAVDLAASGSSGSWSLDSTGKILTLNITENIIGTLAVSIIIHDLNSSSTTEIYFIDTNVTSSNLNFSLRKRGTTGVSDLRTILDAGDRVDIMVSYITSS